MAEVSDSSPAAAPASTTQPKDDTAQYVYFHSGSEAAYRKVKSTTKPPTGGSSSSSSFTSIPTIDLADLIDSPSPPGARRAVAARVADACRRCGFFYVANHGVPDAVVAETGALLRRFFALGHEAKMDAHVHKNPAIRGYEPLLETRLDPTTKGDLKEAFTMGDCALEPEQDYVGRTGRPPPPHITRPQNIWPRAAEPWWRAGLYRYYHHVLPLAMRLVPVVALALGLEETALDGLFRFPITGLRALYYPPVIPTDDNGDTSPGIGLGAHADFSWLTLVLQFGDVPALEVLSPDGAWVPAPPKPGTLVCNVGQYLERQSNGAFPATVHRVRNSTGQGRYSLPFFLTPDPGAGIEPVLQLDAGCFLDQQEEGRENQGKNKHRKPQYDKINVGDLYIRRVLPARPKHPTSIKFRDVPQEEWSYDMLLS